MTKLQDNIKDRKENKNRKIVLAMNFSVTKYSKKIKIKSFSDEIFRC